jgi:hypothetical protein
MWTRFVTGTVPTDTTTGLLPNGYLSLVPVNTSLYMYIANTYTNIGLTAYDIGPIHMGIGIKYGGLLVSMWTRSSSDTVPTDTVTGVLHNAYLRLVSVNTALYTYIANTYMDIGHTIYGIGAIHMAIRSMYGLLLVPKWTRSVSVTLPPDTTTGVLPNGYLRLVSMNIGLHTYIGNTYMDIGHTIYGIGSIHMAIRSMYGLLLVPKW